MLDLSKYCLEIHDSILVAVKKINANRRQFVMIVEETSRLLGILTDGDIRRGLLQGLTVEDCVDKVMNPNPLTAPIGISQEQAKIIMSDDEVRQLPLVDKDHNVVEVLFLDELKGGARKENLAVIMAGGLGSRLRPITLRMPKALVEVDGRPVLEKIILDLCSHGITNILLAVNYMADAVEQHFGDGSGLGVSIHYIREKKRLGTAGALSLINDHPGQPILVMNCDIVTSIDYSALLDYHRERDAVATLCVKTHHIEVPYGIVDIVDEQIVNLTEKPKLKCLVNAGIYVISPQVLDYVPHNEYIDMPEVLSSLLKGGKDVEAFPLVEKWVDIGGVEDLELAHRINTDIV
jgi:dTDP-glucose pyrophosphorylase